jgi:hypothetical protein
MNARLGVLGALCLALLAAAPAAGAAKGRLLVDPLRPVVGAKTSIEVQTRASSPLYVQLVSPTGVRLQTRLLRVGPGLWRAAWHFSDDGQWTLRVPRAGAVAYVHVFQPFAALPPFNPNKVGGSTAGFLSGLTGPGIVFGH